MKTLLAVLILGFGAFIAWRAFGPHTTGSYKDATYTIAGQKVTLVNGIAQSPAAPGSASMVTTRFFGNEIETDLNGDGQNDAAFILTQDAGGSATFYYAVAALNTKNGWLGSEGYFLGDRIAPQSTNLGKNPGVVVFNYADRDPSDAMTTPPSIGKSVGLELDTSTMKLIPGH